MDFFNIIRDICKNNNKAVVRVETRNQYNALMLECDRFGIVWHDSTKASKGEYWCDYKENTIVVFTLLPMPFGEKIDMTYGSLKSAIVLGYPNPINFSDLPLGCKSVDLDGLI